jgi:hypothetical protein
MAQNTERSVVRDMTTTQLVNDRLVYMEAQIPLSTAWQRNLTPGKQAAIEAYAEIRDELRRRVNVTAMKTNLELVRRIKQEGWR